MTIILPKYASRKPMLWLWKANYRLCNWLHANKRNPNCNEYRKYKHDIKVTYGEHRHLPPVVLDDGIKFEPIAVPFQLMRFNGPVEDDGTVLSNWNWL